MKFNHIVYVKNTLSVPQVPPKVEYSLSEKGKTLIPILDLMCQWGEKNLI